MPRALHRPVVALTLVVGTLLAVQAAPVQADDPAGQALARLDRDVDRPLTIHHDRGGTVRSVGVPAGAHADMPSVSASTSPGAAAEVAVARYGAALGTTRPGTTLTRTTVRSTSTGSVARYQQRVDGVPVIGGELVVGLRAGQRLGSLASTLSEVTDVPNAVVEESAATAAAAAVVGRATGRTDLEVTSQGRWLFDRAVLGQGPQSAASGVWRVEVGDGGAVRHLVLIDDQLGTVALDIDENAGLDRVVCDDGNVQRSSDLPCTSGFARTESGAVSPVADVNDAFTLSGEVSSFYASLGLDLTAALGIDVGGVRKLASTVRWCYTDTACPYANAFWNGSQMYYGAGFASADDVVGHEMTHGVVDQFSRLFYWGQSGAINESIADTMGEIVDRRNHGAGEAADVWDLGEDIPGGALRNMADPPEFDQPDRMTSAAYTADDTYEDNAGVHTNSGVGNKTAYLIALGGTFNGQTIAGIDAADPDLSKTAALYFHVIQSLSSGSDYADLADALDQGCQDLVAAGVSGFVADDCTAVHQATVATELRTTPTNAAQPDDAPSTCPAGTYRRVLLDSETGNPATRFASSGGWQRGSSPDLGSNATSGTESWADTRPWSSASMTPTTESLTASAPVALPAGQQSYLWFQGWHVLDYGTVGGAEAYFDGGVVRVAADGGTPADTATLPWINGPTRTLDGSGGNPLSGQVAFGGDSRGWVASRLDLSSWAGHLVTPSFVLGYDNSYTYPGWFLDDVTVYTCDPPLVAGQRPTVAGTARVGGVLTGTGGGWTPAGASLGFQWLRNGAAIAGATRADYTIAASDLGAVIALRVTARRGAAPALTATSAASGRVQRGVFTRRRTPLVTGTARIGRTLRAASARWTPAARLSYQWLRNGRAVAGAREVTYVLTARDRGRRISVRVTGSRAGYTSATATSRPTAKVRPR